MIKIILFYKFVEIKNAEKLRKTHMEFCKTLGVKGKVLLANEGINGSVSGTEEQIDKGKQIKKQGVATTTKGAIGALTMLTEEGFFDTPKDISAIMEKLKEIGRYYPKTAVSMNLLNLQRRKVFSRLKNKDTKKYEYVLRK